ncbi:Ribonuclease T(2) [Handroanthus impetiginosus]|uniref:Ribonuclease T(2) n=1 Tax=Handroanthus impetiginosus TaxID=429701 RepID=A0A2G9I0K2_9LAMI|nr:Ribonuclease T(2) [Handroanthus impetiginosus]
MMNYKELIIAPLSLSCLDCVTSGKKWEKHGTCSSSVLGQEYNYFVTALNVYFKYNVTEVLREAGYVASNSEKYPLGGIISAIQNAFHATPKLECTGDAVQELYLCFYKDFKPRDCAVESNAGSGEVNSKKSCPRYVSFPEYVSLKLGNNETEVSRTTLQSSI